MSNVVYLIKDRPPKAAQTAATSETEPRLTSLLARWFKPKVRRALSFVGRLSLRWEMNWTDERSLRVDWFWRPGFATAIFQFIGRLQKLKGRIFPWRSEIAALRAEIARYQQSTDVRLRAASDHRFALERLLTSSPQARPPGARDAAIKFGDPAVSIVMPTYNRAAFIADAIMSVQAQSFQAWELVIVDDGSTDNTEQIVGQFASDRRILYVRQTHGGAANARNRGIEETSAPLVAYLDSDNLWYPDYLMMVVDHFATNPADETAYGALVSYFHGLESRCILWTPFDRDELLKRNFIDANVFVHRRTLVSRFGSWDEELKRLSDWDLVLRYTIEKPARALNVLGAFYRKCDEIRISDCQDAAVAEAHIKSKLG